MPSLGHAILLVRIDEQRRGFQFGERGFGRFGVEPCCPGLVPLRRAFLAAAVSLVLCLLKQAGFARVWVRARSRRMLSISLAEHRRWRAKALCLGADNRCSLLLVFS